MITSKIVQKVSLLPVENIKFYAYIIPEYDDDGTMVFDVWVFRKDYGISKHAFSVKENIGPDYVKRLDELDYFKEIKYALCESEV